MHRFLLHNGEIHESSSILLSPGQVGVMNGWGVFSTVRVQDGVLFAFERHWARMKRDAALMKVAFPWSEEELRSTLLRLVEANRAPAATLRVVAIRNHGGAFEGPAIRNDVDLVAFTTDLKDWGSSVRLGVVPNGRHAASMFAGTKVLSWAQNLVFYEQAHERGLDEVVLLNERDEVSECTSANIFIVKGSTAMTPPLSSGCLPGVTRELLLEEIRIPGITVREQPLRLSHLEAADEVFITSTTRDLLAVSNIDGLKIRTGSAVRDALQAGFSNYMSKYVHARTAAITGRN